MTDFARVLKIELWRGGGWLLFAIVVIFSVFSQLGDILYRDAFKTWYVVAAVGYSVVGLYPLVAGFGAWLAQRAARLRVWELLSGTDRFGLGKAAVELTALVIWTVSATVGLFIAVILVARQRVEPGIPPYEIIPVVLTAMLAAGAFGYLVGYAFPRLYSPLVAAAIVFGIFQVPRRYAFQSEINGIIPVHLADFVYPSPWDDTYRELALWSSLWFLAVVGVASTAVAFVHRRSLIRGLLVFGAVAGAGFSASLSLARADDAWQWHADNRDLMCVERGPYSFCTVPQASRQELERDADFVVALIAPVAGLPGVPERFINSSTGEPPTGAGTWFGNPFGSEGDMEAMGTAVSLFQTNPGPANVSTASQQAIACWLVSVAGYGCQANAAMTREGASILSNYDLSSIDEAASAEISAQLTPLDEQIQAKAAAFAALSPEDRRAWLEAKWDALRAGELTLDELP